MTNKVDAYIKKERDRQAKKAKPFSQNKRTLNGMSDKLINPSYVDPMWKNVK